MGSQAPPFATSVVVVVVVVVLQEPEIHSRPEEVSQGLYPSQEAFKPPQVPLPQLFVAQSEGTEQGEPALPEELVQTKSPLKQLLL